MPAEVAVELGAGARLPPMPGSDDAAAAAPAPAPPAPADAPLPRTRNVTEAFRYMFTTARERAANLEGRMAELVRGVCPSH